MSGFSADWLSLREEVDGRARNRDVLAALAAHVAERTALHVTDLASGTGSSVRALKANLAATQRWRLTDHDPALLDAARAALRAHGPDVPVTFVPCDLAAGIDEAIAAQTDLITTSAFLDLVSARWLDAMVAAIVRRGLPFYAALSYDGRISCDPAHPLDGLVTAAVNRHQRGDKGLGPALGPDAAAYAIALFEKAGYTVTSGRSDWQARPEERDFQKELVRGWAEAAAETGLVPQSDLEDWLAARLAAIGDGLSRITVGHVDFLAHPAPSAAA